MHTPVCACSRAEILTGKFFHNLADTADDPEDPWDRKGNTYGALPSGLARASPAQNPADQRTP